MDEDQVRRLLPTLEKIGGTLQNQDEMINLLEEIRNSIMKDTSLPLDLDELVRTWKKDRIAEAFIPWKRFPDESSRDMDVVPIRLACYLADNFFHKISGLV